MPHSEAEAYLRGIPGSDRTRAAAWDAIYNVPDDAQAEQVLRQLPYDEHIKAQLWDYRTKALAEAQPPDANKSLRRAVGAFAEALNPVTAFQTLKQAITPAEAGGVGPNQTLRNIFDASANQLAQAKTAAGEGRVIEAAGHAAGAVPLIGPAAVQAGERIASGDIAGGIGEGAALVAGAGLAGPAARGVGQAARVPAQATARRLYQSALKPAKATLKDVRPRGGMSPQQTLLQTGLDEAIPITARGVKKVENLIDSLNAEVQARIAAAKTRGAQVDPAIVEQAIDDVARDFTTQVNAQPDLSAIETVRQNFRRNPNVAQPSTPATPADFAAGQISGRPAQTAPGPIDIDVAQQMKSNTYQGLRGKYGQERGATIEAEKAGARGLREGIEQAASSVGIDDIRATNAREGSLISLEHALADAMRRRGNYDVLGLKPAIGAATAAASESALPLLVTLVDRFPGLVSRTGIWVNRTGRRSGRLTQEAARGAAAGNATSPSESRTRTTGPAWSIP